MSSSYIFTLSNGPVTDALPVSMDTSLPTTVSIHWFILLTSDDDSFIVFANTTRQVGCKLILCRNNKINVVMYNRYGIDMYNRYGIDRLVRGTVVKVVTWAKAGSRNHSYPDL